VSAYRCLNYADPFGLCASDDGSDTIQTRSAHASELCVQAGDTVQRGQTVAMTGSSGTSDAHLHFELRFGGGLGTDLPFSYDPIGEVLIRGGVTPIGDVSTLNVRSGASPGRTLRGVSRPHKGWDLRSRTPEPIRATMPGVVVFAGWMEGYGNVVIINHVQP